MSSKLNQGEQFPEIQLSIAGAGKLTIPTDIQTPYAFLLFYRGHW